MGVQCLSDLKFHWGWGDVARDPPSVLYVPSEAVERVLCGSESLRCGSLRKELTMMDGSSPDSSPSTSS